MGSLEAIVKPKINKIKFNDSVVNIQLIMMLQRNIKTVHSLQQHGTGARFMALNL